ncbi:glycoside hydrolase superfamily [Endogone sp. FLAS-F59071]|nr:glycoside hydrolase superfamily [Endogone sp. FLAS-F59071]|eukprot:RUS19835.1 glycoside hydrolase superfamily [Endogone sp. FLAS-F59071]
MVKPITDRVHEASSAMLNYLLPTPIVPSVFFSTTFLTIIMKRSSSLLGALACLVALVNASPLPSLQQAKRPTDSTGLPSLSKMVSVGTGNTILDALGRERYFHGVNVIYKGAPYYPVYDHFDPQYSFSVEDAQTLQDLNINVIRLGVEWVATEPVRGSYNFTYLDQVKAVVDIANQYNIYVLLDMHQDVYAEEFCGEGFPHWTITKDVGFPVPVKLHAFTVDSMGIPTECASISWAEGQLSIAASKAYQDLYSNVNGTLDSFAAFWKLVASTFKDNVNVLGYELMNEPWVGSQFDNPLLLVPGVADSVNLQKTWNTLANAIREVDQDTMIYFEGVTFDNGVVGFSSVPGGSEFANKSVYSYHYYTPSEGTDITGLDLAITANKLQAARLGSSLFLTEFDLGYDGGSNHAAALKTIQTADAKLQSWIGYSYKSYVPITGNSPGLWNETTGEIYPQQTLLYARTYASAVQGQAISMSFNDTSYVFSLQFTADVDNVQGPTEIRISKTVYYPNGVNVVVASESSHGSATWSLEDDDRIVAVVLASGVKTGDIVNVSVSPL